MAKSSFATQGAITIAAATALALWAGSALLPEKVTAQGKGSAAAQSQPEDPSQGPAADPFGGGVPAKPKQKKQPANPFEQPTANPFGGSAPANPKKKAQTADPQTPQP